MGFQVSTTRRWIVHYLWLQNKLCEISKCPWDDHMNDTICGSVVTFTNISVNGIQNGFQCYLVRDYKRRSLNLVKYFRNHNIAFRITWKFPNKRPNNQSTKNRSVNLWIFLINIKTKVGFWALCRLNECPIEFILIPWRGPSHLCPSAPAFLRQKPILEDLSSHSDS